MKNRSFLKLLIGALAVFNLDSCTIKEPVPPANELKHFTSTVALAYNDTQSDPSCFIDLDMGAVYPVSEAAAHAGEIDLVYVPVYLEDNPFMVSIGVFDGHNGYTDLYWDKQTLGIEQFSTYNHTVIRNSNNTVTGFETMSTVADFDAGIGDYLNNASNVFDDEQVNGSRIGDIYVFRTQQNKRGAFKLLDAQNGSNGFATIEIKIEP
jgi:hypothetical protein